MPTRTTSTFIAAPRPHTIRGATQCLIAAVMRAFTYYAARRAACCRRLYATRVRRNSNRRTMINICRDAAIQLMPAIIAECCNIRHAPSFTPAYYVVDATTRDES